HKPWPLSSAVAPRLDTTQLLEEEKTPDYHPDRFYPAPCHETRLWRQFDGLAGSRSAPLALVQRKICRRKTQRNCKSIEAITNRQRGTHFTVCFGTKSPPWCWHFVRKLSDSFQLEGVSGGKHHCLVLGALREPLWVYRERYIGGFIPVNILKILLQMTLQALDYLHSECHVIHTDLKPDNIMIKIEDPSIFEEHALNEFHRPLPQKHRGDRVIYLSRNNYGPLKRPTGIIQLMDFDLSDGYTIELSKLRFFRAPGVILDAGYTSSADIWSLGVLLRDLFERNCPIDPHTPEKPDEYDEAVHLAQITSVLGYPPGSLVSSWRRSSMFYDDNSKVHLHHLNQNARVTSIDPVIPRNPQPLSHNIGFEGSINQIKGEEKTRFIGFVKRMIEWKPEERSTAKELLGDTWLYEDFPHD
ncbi:unnamed protein product, partial [Clonostachys chloroleuca]